MLMLSLKALGSEWVPAFVEQIVLVNHARKTPIIRFGFHPLCAIRGVFFRTCYGWVSLFITGNRGQGDLGNIINEQISLNSLSF